VIWNDRSDPLSVVKSHYESNSLDHLYATNTSAIDWNSYGVDGYIPYTVLFDMDGAMRLQHTGNLTGNMTWETCIKQCSGNWP